MKFNHRDILNCLLVTVLLLLTFSFGSATANETTARNSSEAKALAKKYERSANLNTDPNVVIENHKLAIKYYEIAGRLKLTEGDKDPLELALLKANCAQQAAYLSEQSRQNDFLNDAKTLTSSLKIEKGLNAAALFELAKIELNAGKYDSAKAHFTQLTKYFGKKNTYLSAATFAQLGWCEHSLGLKNQAIKNFRTSLSYADVGGPGCETVIARLYIPGAIGGSKFREFKPSDYPTSINDVHSIAKALVTDKRYFEGEILNRYVIWLTDQPQTMNQWKNEKHFMGCGLGPPIPNSVEQYKIVALQNLLAVYAATGQLSKLKETSTNIIALAHKFKSETPKWTVIKDDALRQAKTQLAVVGKLKP